MAFQCIVWLYIALIGACVIALAIGSFLYIIASSECIKGNLLSIDRCAKTNQNILEQFTEFIEFHSLVKQFSRKIVCCQLEAFQEIDALYSIHTDGSSVIRIFSANIYNSFCMESGHDL